MTTVTIPTILTARLRLRPPLPEDFPRFAACLGSPRAVHVGGPHDETAAWGRFCHGLACWSLFGHGALTVEPRAGGASLGIVDISLGPRFPERELGWILFDGAEGRGIATEAASALRDWAAARGWTGLVSYIDPANHRSIAVAHRLGARLDPQAVPQDPGDLVYRHRAAGPAA